MSTTSNTEAPAPKLRKIPMVLAPDIILDLIGTSATPERSRDAELLFDAIVADIEQHNDERPIYVCSITVPIIYYQCERSGPSGKGVARSVMDDLLHILRVVEMSGEDYYSAIFFKDFEYEDALQFLACRRVNAKYLITNRSFGGKRRTPTYRRTAGEILPLFR